MESKTITKQVVACYHCGENCKSETVQFDNKNFCCDGCRLVYEILSKNDLCEYYALNEKPGITQKVKVKPDKFSYLDDTKIKNKLINFTNGNETHITFHLPQMHCSSCIWVLENLNKLNNGIVISTVNFPLKEIKIAFHEDKTSLRKIAELLTGIGYEPYISLNELEEKKIKELNRSKIYKLGVAGFCFGNIMLLSFPEYFSVDTYIGKDFEHLFRYINLILALPVFLYSASEFYISAYKGLKNKFLNIDAPIVLAVLVTFSRSVYEIVSGTGAGYLDSMSGIVFFMLVGRIFQGKTYDYLSFERDYKSYFPVAVKVKKEDKEEDVSLSDLRVGDRIIVRNNELIPADAILLYGKATVDYSFVTGESVPVNKTLGEIVYAGGRQVGEKIEMEVIKEVSQSYLTGLWNNEAFKNNSSKHESFIHKLSKYFTYILFSIAAIASVYWAIHDSSKILTAVTAVLIVACPCALLLSATFTNGNVIRIFSNNKFYVRDASVIEDISKVNHVVFDKTGTLTKNTNAQLTFNGEPLDDYYKKIIHSLVLQSSHPLSKAIEAFTHENGAFSVEKFKEFEGEGIQGIVDGNYVKIGSREFVLKNAHIENSFSSSTVYVSVNDNLLGFFLLKNLYRDGAEELIHKLRDNNYTLSVLSGDNDADKEYLTSIISKGDVLFFQKPQDKLNYIKKIANEHSRLMMVGDGLNDAGALKQSDVGIVVSENTNNFSPACDAILDASKFNQLDKYISMAKAAQRIIYGSFVISICYNIVGLYFAVQGTLSPVIAAILMPVSSVSIVLFTTGASSLSAKWRNFKT